MAELGQQTVEFSTIVSRTADESFLSLKDLIDKSKSTQVSDSERKINLLKFIVNTQQRFLRLNVLAKWCQQLPLIQYSQQLVSTLSSHDACFAQTADSLFYTHEGLRQERAPIYDVPSATEILLTGSYKRLPKCIEDVGMQGVLNEDQQKPALRKLDVLVRSKLLETSLPKEISEVIVSDGTAQLHVEGEFKVLVTLGYRGHLHLWRILHLEILVGERSGPVQLAESRQFALGDELERRMAAADEQQNPFMVLYSVLHEFCIAFVMDTVIRQVHALRLGRWKDAIKFELISDGSGAPGGVATSMQITQDGEYEGSGYRTSGVKILYWLDLDKNFGSTDAGCPFIKIEPGPNLQIKCVHSTFVIDPSTDKEADLYLDQCCIDVEKLLLQAIRYNRYTRLFEINKELLKNGETFRANSDVLLQCNIQCNMDETNQEHQKKDVRFHGKQSNVQEVLSVRAYGSSFFILGINIRNGRYQLQSSTEVITPSALSESEEALNQGTLNATEVFINLRSKTILHLFARIGKFLGLEVFENGLSSVKVPKSISGDSSYLLMGFPNCGNSYFLLLQPDTDFKIIFKLLEMHPDPVGRSNTLDVVRLKKIDVSKMQMLDDAMNLSILDLEKVSGFLPRVGIAPQSAGCGLISDSSHDGSMSVAICSPSGFSSIVDEVFELEKTSTAGRNISSSLSMSAAPHLSSLSPNSQSTKAGVSSQNLDGNVQMSHINSSVIFSTQYNDSKYLSSNFKGLSQSHGRNSTLPILSVSKSEQDLASLRSPQSMEVGSLRSMDEDHLRFMNEPSRGVISGRSSHFLSPPRPNHPRLLSSGVNVTTFRNLLDRSTFGATGVPRSSSCSTTPVSSLDANLDTSLENDKTHRKREFSKIANLLPLLRGHLLDGGVSKRRRLTSQPLAHIAISSNKTVVSERYNFGDLIAEANKGNALTGIYISSLLHVVRHCSLCIKHAMLTSQMEALDIPYVEEVGLSNAYSNIWFRLPTARGDSWPHICLRLGRPGKLCWDVKISDQHFTDLWELQNGSSNTPWGSGVRIANTSDIDSHIRYDSEGVVLSYKSVETDSIKKLLTDICRLSCARMFALGMQKLLGVKAEEKLEENASAKGPVDGVNKLSEQMRRAFRIEAVGLMSLWFSFGTGVLARFVVEWESGKEGCTMHVSPDQLWPHTKFLEDFINGGEVSSLLDCIRLTAGPLHALAAATMPARAGQGIVPGVGSALSTVLRQGTCVPPHGVLPSSFPPNVNQPTNHTFGNFAPSTAAAASALSNHASAMLAAAGRGGSGGILPSSLLPIDVSVVLRGPYWIRIIFRKCFAVDMRCFAGDQVWLQPATPPKVGPSVGGSLLCPQFRPFIMEHVAQELNWLEPNFVNAQQTVGGTSFGYPTPNISQLASANESRANISNSSGVTRPGTQVGGMNLAGNSLVTPSNVAAMSAGLALRRSPAAGVPSHFRGELNTAIIGLGDDGGYGGGWVPVVALKKVLRGILKYLGVLWLFAQLPDLLKEILGSILKENEGALLNLDQEQPTLRFFIGGYVFAVSVHRVQLLLQVVSVKRGHQQQQQNSTTAQEELTQSEISEICDYFSRRVASEPYDASRVASFITLFTLPVSVLREFLKLITWKKVMSQTQGGDVAPSQKPCVELCLENHGGLNPDGTSGTKSNIRYDRPHNSVDFALTVVLDPAHIPHINTAGGAAWLPYCVLVRLRYLFGENPSVSFIGMEGSHGGRACWFRIDDWEKCKQRVARSIEAHGTSAADVSQGRLKLVADNVQRTLHLCLQGLRDGSAGLPGHYGAM